MAPRLVSFVPQFPKETWIQRKQHQITGNGFNKVHVIMYILPSRKEREIMFEATRTCVWLKLDVCSMCVRLATQQSRFIVNQFKTISLFSNRDSKVTKRIPSSSSSSSLDSIALNDRFKRAQAYPSSGL